MYHLNMTKQSETLESLIEKVVSGSTVAGLKDVLVTLGIEHKTLSTEQIAEILVDEVKTKRNIKSTKDLYNYLCS